MERPVHDIRLSDALRICLEDLQSAGIDRLWSCSPEEAGQLETLLTISQPQTGVAPPVNSPSAVIPPAASQRSEAAESNHSTFILPDHPMSPKPKSPQTVPSDPATQAKIAAALALSDQREECLLALAKIVQGCTRCPILAPRRTNTVFGSGNPNAELVFVGEGPGADEDAQGLPFVGRSGQLLTDIIEKGMRISRSEVYICNIVRCRPPENRRPTDEEAAFCRPFLDATLGVIRPKYLCLLGATAAQSLLGTTESIGKLRGRAHEYRGAQVICTYHPSYLLRNPAAKRQTWEDIKLLLQIMGRKVSP